MRCEQGDDSPPVAGVPRHARDAAALAPADHRAPIDVPSGVQKHGRGRGGRSWDGGVLMSR
jgi:hypothetical protein